MKGLLDQVPIRRDLHATDSLRLRTSSARAKGAKVGAEAVSLLRILSQLLIA
jgi:hypothetical protein